MPVYNVWGLDNLGQVRRSGSTLTRYSYLKDHLGSIRMTVNGGTIVVADDFSGDLSKWTTVLGGGFFISGGQLMNSSPGADNVAVNSSSGVLADGTIDVDVTNLSSGYCDASIVVRYQDPANYYLVHPYGSTISIYRRLAGTYSLLATAGIPGVFIGGPYHLKIDVSGHAFALAWNGQTVLTWTDPDPNSWLTGKVGVRQCISRPVAWDNFVAPTNATGSVDSYADY